MKTSPPPVEIPTARITVEVTSFVPVTQTSSPYSKATLTLQALPPPGIAQPIAGGPLQVTRPVWLEFAMLSPNPVGNFLPIGAACDRNSKEGNPKWLKMFPESACVEAGDGTRVLRVLDKCEKIKGGPKQFHYEFDLVIQRLKDHAFGVIDPEVMNED